MQKGTLHQFRAEFGQIFLCRPLSAPDDVSLLAFVQTESFALVFGLDFFKQRNHCQTVLMTSMTLECS